MDPRGIETVPEAGDGASAELPSRLGHFEIVGRLGAGGMGVVFEGRDSVLGRRVALKLLHPASGAPARLLREAQALAKLSHPNVVTVYEIGLAGDNPFVAMELVEGVTLREWMITRREWRSVLDLFIGVGHGLAAAHALGLVHRDFKPANVLVDRSGVPKLGDFGLVSASDSNVGAVARSDETGADVATVDTLTRPGSVMGTPAYMPPEQRRGESVDERADQFSFAKSLREALHEPYPAALDPILDRALSAEASARFPTMKHLLDELARVRRGRRSTWIASGVAAGTVAAVLVAWGAGRAQTATSDEPCPRPTDRMADVWSPARRLALEAHLHAIDPSRGRDRFATIARAFDRGAEQWGDQHVDACQMNHVGRQSDTLLDRRMSCLDRALYELDETVRVVESTTTVASLDEAIGAVMGLPTLAACADVTALADKLPASPNPAHRSEAAAITREIVDIDVTLRTGGTRTGVDDRANAVVKRARALKNPESLADALRVLAAVQLENEAGEAAPTLREAITAAAAAHDDRSVAMLWMRLLVTMVKLKRAPEAEPLVPAAEAAFARATPSAELRAAFLDARAQVAVKTGKASEALQLLAEAIVLLERAGATTPGSPLAPMLLDMRMREATTFGLADDWPRAVAALKLMIPQLEAQVGPDHPSVLRAHFNLGTSYYQMRNYPAALVAYREAARIGEARLAPSPNLAGLDAALGSTFVLMNQPEEAIPYLERAVAMARATMPANDIRLAGYIGSLGGALMAVKRHAEARVAMNEQIAILDHHELTADITYGNALYNLGYIDFDTGHCDTGIGHAERALAIYEAVGGNDHYDVDGARALVAECQLALARPGEALRTSARVLGTTGVAPGLHAWASFIHGRARAAIGERQAGIDEVRAARAEAVGSSIAEVSVDTIDRWLATHARSR
jgi:tetratricopeptide (TPR) repeat protein